MRVAYNNLIDSLAASAITVSSTATGYPNTNLQDQRLTTTWKGTGSTDESVIFTLNTFPEYPDKGSTTSYMWNFNATSEGFIATSGTIDYTTYSGIIRLSASSANSYIGKSSLYISTGSTVIIKMRSPALLSTTVNIYNEGFTNLIGSISGISTTFSMYSFVTTNLATTLYIQGTNTATSGTVFDIDGIYTGTGEYTTQLTDNSGNGMDLTAYGIVSSNGFNMSLDGINDYLRTTNAPTTLPDLLLFDFYLPNGNSSLSHQQC